KVKCEDGSEIHPIILHTAPGGGLERIIWGMLESNLRKINTHVPGFPLWISPIQVRVIPVKPEFTKECEKLMILLNNNNIRADLDDRNETLGKKIRNAEQEWIPYVIIFGKNEISTNTISVRKRLIGQPRNNNKGFENIKGITVEEFISRLNDELNTFPRHKLPVPFRKMSTKIHFR
ncbi:MAG: His/Gly/Thr/Pro-type tRNA ligase C-terminal domain-containing protein, partial [Promethearchaeota archaeon]